MPQPGALAGHIEVISGPMFSGKSETLIGRLRRCHFARQVVQVFKPQIDKRFGDDCIASHSAMSLEARPVPTAAVLAHAVLPKTQVVGIDEAQFFDSEIVDVAERLAQQGKRVIIAGLDLDYRAQPFENMAHLLAIAEYVTKTLAVCMRCGAPASRSQRLIGGDDRFEIGATEAYEARCRHCHQARAQATTVALFPGDDTGV